MSLQGKGNSGGNAIDISNHYNNSGHIHNTSVCAKCTAFITMINIYTVHGSFHSLLINQRMLVNLWASVTTPVFQTDDAEKLIDFSKAS